MMLASCAAELDKSDQVNAILRQMSHRQSDPEKEKTDAAIVQLVNLLRPYLPPHAAPPPDPERLTNELLRISAAEPKSMGYFIGAMLEICKLPAAAKVYYRQCVEADAPATTAQNIAYWRLQKLGVDPYELPEAQVHARTN